MNLVRGPGSPRHHPAEGPLPGAVSLWVQRRGPVRGLCQLLLEDGFLIIMANVQGVLSGDGSPFLQPDEGTRPF